ncbi:hypothetical protein SLEP1_g1761 [Rubroshorea leprosula]|uniref:Uncharacterized protein n=1 Tax=Rubroshorea leprosula TaxID=152421 RepID=A0AAV5HPD9_9ROSI|nr:hypothetical protein SLEP1_g1761 [Rubroshorea leprosula]
MCKLVDDNVKESVQTNLKLKKNIQPLEWISADITRLLSSSKPNPHTSEQPVVNADAQSQAESQNTVSGTSSIPPQQNDSKLDTVADIDMKDPGAESKSEKAAVAVDVPVDDLAGEKETLKDCVKVDDSDSDPNPTKSLGFYRFAPDGATSE